MKEKNLKNKGVIVIMELIEEQDRLYYKKRLEAFSQKINSKPDKQTIELLKQQYIKRRNKRIFGSE